MKVLFFSKNKMIIYLNDFYTKELNFQDKDEIESYFKKIFIKLKDKYQIKTYGYYNIVLYHDINYGAVIELSREENEYYKTFDTSLDMKIMIEKDNSFLYELEDPFVISSQLLKDSALYFYHNKLYLQLKEKIDYIELGELLEHSILKYKNISEILKYGKECIFP